jgi:hypothetical protein
MNVGPSRISVSRSSPASFLRAAISSGSRALRFLYRRFTMATLTSCTAAHLQMRQLREMRRSSLRRPLRLGGGAAGTADAAIILEGCGTLCGAVATRQHLLA